MYSEIIKIIEGGLKKDLKKVHSYSKLLADKFKEEGDEKMAALILNLLNQKMTNSITLDELISQVPVDQDSRMNILDVYIPESNPTPLVLSSIVQGKIESFINSISHRQELLKHGVISTSTLLLYGAPGVGKTSIAKYISEQTGLPLVVARLDAIVSSLLGNTAKNIRKIFEYADSKPCILFLDEFDAIAKSRDDKFELGELKRVINSLLQNIDAFSQNNILIAATNHAELLDKAIWRRFNTVIEVAIPSQEDTASLIKLFLKGFDTDFLDDKKKLDKIAELVSGKSPSDIKSILHRAITQSIIEKEKLITFQEVLIEVYDFEHHSKYSVDELVKYLDDNGVAKTQIAEKLDISIRQVRNKLHEN
jgi:SpoVK/Ycf46/Vps4 family AAA+-type ATPase